MATRSLTEVFILMRNNALQNRHIFSEQVSSPTPSTLEIGAVSLHAKTRIHKSQTCLIVYIEIKCHCLIVCVLVYEIGRICGFI